MLRGRWKGKGGETHDREETSVDTPDTFLSDDGHRTVDETAVLRLWTFGVVDQFSSTVTQK